jgi:NDP-sugar pyrophosphorylase family protein
MTTRGGEFDLAPWPVAILAGGLATRLRPITEKIPKALVEVAGEPFLAHQLRLLRAAGIRKVVVCISYLGEMIEAQFGDGAQFGVELRYSYDGARLLGTGGALKKALPSLGERFFVLYGDSYLPIEYSVPAQHFAASNKLGLMTVFKNEGRWDASNVWFENDTIRLYDKKQALPQMKHIDYGLGLFQATAFAQWSEGEAFDLADVYRALIAREQLAGFQVEQRFYEIGSPEGLAELDALLKRPEVSPPA